MHNDQRYISISGELIPESIRNWIDTFDADPTWSHVRFKTFGKLPGYIPDRFPARLWELVSREDFEKVEENRLPLFMGTQFGISPRPHTVLPNDQERIIAILGYSALSGNIGGLSVRTINPTGSTATSRSNGDETVSPSHKTIEVHAKFRNQPL